MISSTSFFYLLSALSLVASQSPSNCAAVIRLNSLVPGHGAYMYHDIIVENTGSCAITKVFASISLPPYVTPFEYKNVSSTTGELFGLSNPLPTGRYILLYNLFPHLLISFKHPAWRYNCTQ